MDKLDTQPLECNSLLIAQLSRIEQAIQPLPSLLARLDTVTESIRDLEETLKETTRDLRNRDEAQQKALDDMRLKQSAFDAALSTLSSEVHALSKVDSRIDKCFDELNSWRPWLSSLKWFLRILGGIAAAALSTGLLWLLARSL